MCFSALPMPQNSMSSNFCHVVKAKLELIHAGFNTLSRTVVRWFNKGLFVFPSRIVISVEGKSTLGEECYVAFVIPRFAPEQQIRSIRELW